MSEGPQADRPRTKAAVRRGWWPGWVWSIPVAAVAVVGWALLRSLAEGGETIQIVFDDAHGLKPKNAEILYRGLKVGEASEATIAKDGKSVIVTASVDDSATEFLRSGTVFWLRGAEPSFSDLSSLGALLSGPSIVMEPGPGGKTTSFAGLSRRPIVTGPQKKPELYELSFSGAVGGLTQGQPVKLRGFTVGEVRTIAFRYDARTGAIETPVTIALYPSLFPIEHAAASDSGAALAAAVKRLVAEGLRARLDRDPPFIGTYQVSLDMLPGAPPAQLSAAEGLPQIPTAAGGGINTIVDRVNKVPLDQIAQNVLDVTHHLDTLVASPQLKDAIAQLDQSLRQVHQVASKAGPKITSLVDSLRRTADRLDETAKAANKVVGGVPSQNGLSDAVREITDAARSVRDLSDYLDRHPEALIQGRSGG
ncbi:MAG: MlaD family protein [Stellaceae bacterium]